MYLHRYVATRADLNATNVVQPFYFVFYVIGGYMRASDYGICL